MGRWAILAIVFCGLAICVPAVWAWHRYGYLNDIAESRARALCENPGPIRVLNSDIWRFLSSKNQSDRLQNRAYNLKTINDKTVRLNQNGLLVIKNSIAVNYAGEPVLEIQKSDFLR